MSQRQLIIFFLFIVIATFLLMAFTNLAAGECKADILDAGANVDVNANSTSDVFLAGANVSLTGTATKDVFIAGAEKSKCH